MSSINSLLQVGAGSFQAANLLSTFAPLVLMIAVFYFGLIRPQRKKEKNIAEMRDKLAVGDEVVTIGGIVGKIVQVKKDYLVLETTGMKTRLELARWSIQTVTKSKGKKEENSLKDEEN